MNESMNIVTLVQIHANLSHSEDGEMSQLILAFRHMILNLSQARYLSVTDAPHNFLRCSLRDVDCGHQHCKHEVFTKCCFHVGPASKTMDQY